MRGAFLDRQGDLSEPIIYAKSCGWYRGAGRRWRVHRRDLSRAVAIDVFFEGVARLTWSGWRAMKPTRHCWGRFWVLGEDGVAFRENAALLELRFGWDGSFTSVLNEPRIEVPCAFQVVRDLRGPAPLHHVARLRDFNDGEDLLNEQTAEVLGLRPYLALTEEASA